MVMGNTVRRGLVLEGGGAKGAWQFGVLQALAESGIHFDVVSGTSVGALNGAIWCADRLDVGKEMWSSMSLPRVFALKFWLLPVVILGFPTRIFYALFKGYEPSTTKSGRALTALFKLVVAIALLAGFWGLLLMVYERRHPPAFDFLAFEWPRGEEAITFVLVSFAIAAAILQIGAAPLLPRRHSLLTVYWGPAWPCVFLTALYSAGIRPSPLVVSLMCMPGMPILLLGIAWLLRSVNVSAFVPRPLETIIRTVLTDGLRTPFLLPPRWKSESISTLMTVNS
jgi:hypothetical protein